METISSLAGSLAEAPPSREVLDTAGDLLRALAAPVRIAIVLQLMDSQRCVHELVEALQVPQPLVSQHLNRRVAVAWMHVRSMQLRSSKHVGCC